MAAQSFTYMHKEQSKQAIVDLFAAQSRANPNAFTPAFLDLVVAAVNALPDRPQGEVDQNTGQPIDDGVRIEASANGSTDLDQPQRSYINVSARYVTIPLV